ncbi:MAG: DNA methylase N-4, partial [Clostridia bacterium]|nr:DNA methylase N-4 [Clostridia bacterium]
MGNGHEKRGFGMTYEEFLRSKMELATEAGFYVPTEQLHDVLKPHQKDSVQWALKGGRRAIFAKFGMGKTIMQIEFNRQVLLHEGGGRALFIVPLGVKQEFAHDAVELIGIEAPKYIKSMAEANGDGMYITNYERVRDGDIDPKEFVSVTLDEAAVLRSFGSKTYQTFLKKFKGVKYKLCCTATPDPNKYKELIHYGGFLEIMDTGQALTRFFQRDSTKANNLTLYPHKEEEFWLWISSWALFIGKPSDVNPEYSDEGYDLPPLQVNWHRLPYQTKDKFDKFGQLQLFTEASATLQDAAEVKRLSIQSRLDKMKDIINADPDAHFLLWHDLEAERHAIKKAIPEAVEVYGSLDLDSREQRVIDFAEGKTRLLATKKEISGSGCNFQKHCHRAIFMGIDYKFNDYIQAIHRIYRFLQTENVIIDIIYTDAEDEIRKQLEDKWERYNKQSEKMAEIVRENGLSLTGSIEKLSRSMGVSRVEIKGKHFTAINNDNVLELEKMAQEQPNSVGLIHTSIPFSNHYEYTPSYNDFGHNEDTIKFFEQMDYLTPNLLKVLKPGRVMAVHVKDRVLFGNTTGTGMPTMEPFHADCIYHYRKHGFQYFGMITITTDVVRENNQTYRLGWSEQCKDGSKMGVGCPEYVLLFRKLPSDTSNAYADEPVTKSKEDYTRAQWQIDAHAYWRSSGDRLLTKDEMLNIPTKRLGDVYRKFSRSSVYNYNEHVALAESL